MKIFCIGYHKTGTTSLDAALRQLGYNVCGAETGLAATLFENNLDPVWELVEEYDAFHDNPWAVLYKELDEQYPNSKFILTTRKNDAWLNSIVRHFGKTHSEMRRWIYGVGFPKGNEKIYLEKYVKHNADVKSYFEDRKDDLLEVSWEEGNGWKELCRFLEQPIPDLIFPHQNRANTARMGKWWKTFKRKLKGE